MQNPNPIAHGGALAAAVKKYGGNKADWLDLSTGINPVPAPLPKLNSSIWQALPDADLMENCLSAARKFYHFPESAALVAAPGVQAIIQLLPHLRPGAKAAILGPTYGEYAHVFQTLGTGCRIINSTEETQQESVTIVVNPNNPDGRILRADALVDFANVMASEGGLLIVDEAFCDLTPDISVARHAGTRGLLVLKSFGKFFGLAGVRLGFAAGHSDDIAILEQHLGPWAVSGPALTIGAGCYSDTGLQTNVSRTIARSSTAQRVAFAKLGLNVIADTSLFHLVEHPQAKGINESLGRQHILTRIFADQPNWLRFGLCKNNAERTRLKLALDACLSAL
jgi:cobalamin biosynthesis protein CobC